MDVVLVECPNQPGEVARVSEAIAAKGINIKTGACLCCGDRGTIGLVTSDESGTRAVLDEAGISYRTLECMTVTMPDRPGELARVSRRLAEAGVNIEFFAPTVLDEETTLAVGVADAEIARKALAG
ncbi:hypothetical protein GCM10012275_38090 [Longimycelium tulufanense]|uniref:ACT domain-containing protein n=1 Tax=Longimycelium tulufanense TaxID=907463 RepID=A0A8J3FV05_9PSEU|nr:ACT domain-containing protein [Longimycelium tulufanense]GGM63909.1 hypothetical protein GCM10012275_38090 [Longimycelium tulufanense]